MFCIKINVVHIQMIFIFLIFLLPSAGLQRPRDCLDLKFYCPTARSGEYTVYPPHSKPGYQGLRVFCDMATDQGGWTVSYLNKY